MLTVHEPIVFGFRHGPFKAEVLCQIAVPLALHLALLRVVAGILGLGVFLFVVALCGSHGERF